MDIIGAGGSNDAGSVQVIFGRADRSAIPPIADDLAATLRRMRPDVVGATAAWPNDARAAESAGPMSDEDRVASGRLSSLIEMERVVDLSGFDGDQLGDDPAAAWGAAADRSIVAVRDEAARAVPVSFGDISGQEYVSQLSCDHLIHGWDLARAIGADEALDPDMVDFASDLQLPHVDGWRSAGVFGPPVQVPAGAGCQDELLAVTGRRP